MAKWDELDAQCKPENFLGKGAYGSVHKVSIDGRASLLRKHSASLLLTSKFFCSTRSLRKSILLDAEFNAKLCDFGIAKVTEVSIRGTCIGTPLYMSPEMLESYKTSPKGDIFGIGLVLWELIKRKSWLPVEPPTQFFLINFYKRNEDGVTIEFAQEELRDFIQMCTKLDEKNRWATADKALQRIDEILKLPPYSELLDSCEWKPQEVIDSHYLREPLFVMNKCKDNGKVESNDEGSVGFPSQISNVRRGDEGSVGFPSHISNEPSYDEGFPSLGFPSQISKGVAQAVNRAYKAPLNDLPEVTLPDPTIKVSVLLDGQDNKLELDFGLEKATLNDLHTRLLSMVSQEKSPNDSGVGLSPFCAVTGNVREQKFLSKEALYRKIEDLLATTQLRYQLPPTHLPTSDCKLRIFQNAKMLTDMSEMLINNATYVAINTAAIQHRMGFQKVIVQFDEQHNQLALEFPCEQATLKDLHTRLLPIFTSVSSDFRLRIYQEREAIFAWPIQQSRSGIDFYPGTQLLQKGLLTDLNKKLNADAPYTVRYATIKLIIQTYLGTKFTLVNKKEKIEIIWELLWNEGVRVLGWRIFLSGKELIKRKTFEEYGITEESNLRVESGIQINATDANGKREWHVGWESETIGDVLEEFQNYHNLSGTALYLDGQRLEENRTIASYNLPHECELEMN